ncbi:MAG: outer membrane beta-barrel protein [Bacteroidaceae bacterium]|nr:outer membrane beta-barrel protein [Bacteroidaceae bacterium]
MKNRIQTRLKALLAAALLTTASTAQAEEAPENYVPYPHAFISAQGGGQLTFSNYNNWQYITPTASLGVGVHFTPVFGARVHVNGLWNKAGIRIDGVDTKYSWKYATSNLDAMINLVNLFKKNNYNPVNVYLIGGVGINYSWDNETSPLLKQYLNTIDTRARLSHNFRVGTMLDVKVARNWSVNLEVDANSLSDRYNSKYSGSDDWQLTAQVGVTYKFGVKKKKPAPVEEVWETRIDTIWYDDVVYTPITKDGKATWNVFYKIRESDFDADAQLAAIGAFLKDHRDCKVSIKSYADVQTGNPKINMEYSKQRSEKAVKALTDAGVPASSITANYYGDTVQPFAENDKNRVTIIEASGLKDLKKEDKVKKFKTKEVRYRVQ